MNSNNESDQFDTMSWFIGGCFLCLMAYLYWVPITIFFVTLLSIVVGAGLLVAYAWGAWKIMHRAPSLLKRKEKMYSAKEIDAIENYCPEMDDTVNTHEKYSAAYHDWEMRKKREKLQAEHPELFIQKEVPKREVRIDTDKLLTSAAHWRNEIDADEEAYLSRADYTLDQFVPFGEVQARECWIRGNSIESLEHTFVVAMIANELRHYSKKVRIYLTKAPDVVFEHKGQDYAVEVETPLGLPYKHKRLALKAQENNTLYPQRWVIVVTKSAYAKCFKRYTTVLRRNDVPNWIHTLFHGKLLPEHTPPID